MNIEHLVQKRMGLHDMQCYHWFICAGPDGVLIDCHLTRQEFAVTWNVYQRLLVVWDRYGPPHDGDFI